MPEGSSLERNAQAAREIAPPVRIERSNGLRDYAGVWRRRHFNGLVRHYLCVRGANVADLQINLVPKNERKAQSHDIARACARASAEIAAKFGARVCRGRSAARPASVANLVAEIYGPTEENVEDGAKVMIFSTTRPASWTRTGILRPTSRKWNL